MLSSLRKFNPLGVAASVGLRSALPKVLLGAALLGGAGSVLFAGSAQAASLLTFAQWAGGTPLEVGDKKFTYASSSGGAPPSPNDIVSATQPVSGNYLFNYDFDPVSPIPTFTLNYIAEVTDPGYFFSGVDLSSTVDAFAPAEQLDATWRTGSFAGPVAATLSSVGGSESQVDVAGEPQTLYVTNDYASNGGAIDSFVNSYKQGTTTVPGPLPLVGAGMAFGFSRKLRSRIKARVQA